MQINAIRVNPKDNVAVAIREIKAGEAVTGIEGVSVRANEDIMRNHKVALVEVPEGESVIKYGETIGRASRPIQAGDWVHTHNLRWEED